MAARKNYTVCAALALFCALLGLTLSQASETEAFFRTKTVDLIIASEAGGGCDLYARLAAPFLEEHVPANLRVVPKKMITEGCIVATNYLTNLACKDGTVIAQLQNMVWVQPLFILPQKSDPY